jgi:hypothetical protein
MTSDICRPIIERRLEMVDVEIRAAEGGEDSRLLIDVLAGCYKRRALVCG